MGPVRIVKAKYSAFVDSGRMRQEEGEIVPNDLIFPVNPDLLAKNTYSAGTPKSSFVIGFFAKIALCAHITLQMMRVTQHLITSLLSLQT
jgi:hypothetical protein